MGRRPKPHWNAREAAWLAPLGAYSETNRRRRYVVLRDAGGGKIGPKDERGAFRAMDALIEAEDEAARRAASASPTVSDMIGAYLAWQEARGAKPATIEGHALHLGRFERFVGPDGYAHGRRPAASIRLADLARVRKAMEARGNQPGYIRHLYASVLACWRWAARPVEDREPERLLATNPLEGAQRPTKGRERPPVVPWPVIEQLIAFATERAERAARPWRPAARLKVTCFKLIAESGCRPKEACTLEWEWVHEAERAIVIPRESHKTGEATGTARIFGLTRETTAALAALRATGPPHERWVFATGDRAASRHRMGSWWAELKAAAIGAGIDVPPKATLYSLRHSLVTQARQGGIEFRDMAGHMGHSEQVAEGTYYAEDLANTRARFDRMDRARRGESGE